MKHIKDSFNFLDLFSQAIQNSGSSFGEWAVTNRVIPASEELGKELGCDIQDSKKFKDCMKEKTIDEIWDATANVVSFFI
uniref:Carboxylesterase type B domain-containing protein n=1 Tax=Panagrolaimus davidi TaxID=227884 RepID=A0A914QFM4_9BILA